MAALSLDVNDVARIAADAASQYPDVEVLGVSVEGGSDYAEILVRLKGCQSEPCRMTMGVFRDLPADELLRQLSARLDEHMRQHRA